MRLRNWGFLSFLYIVINLTSSTLPLASSEVGAPENTQLGFEVPGLYTIHISPDIVTRTKAAVKATQIPFAEGACAIAFERLFHPEPNALFAKREISPLSLIIFRIKDKHDLPLFSTTTHKVRSERVQAYRQFLTEQDLSPEKLSDITKEFDEALDALETEEKDLMEQYAQFYKARTSPLRRQGIVSYLCEFLVYPYTEETEETRHNRILIVETLQSTGFLQLQAPFVNGIFQYSPLEQVRAYIKQHGVPKQIILGCTHSNIRALSEKLYIGDEAWCGCCENLPHNNAMVVSLHEGAADVLTDLNHPDLWEAIPSASIPEIKDETWDLGAYTPETLAHIARVLTPDGIFRCDVYHEESDTVIVEQLKQLGLTQVSIDEVPITEEHSRKTLKIQRPKK